MKQKEAALAPARGGDRQLPLRFFQIFFSLMTTFYCSRLIHWNPAPAPANPDLPDDSSESYKYSPVPYGERDALRFKAERDESRCKLGEISKKACITELEWEDQRKQLLATIEGISLRLTSNPLQLLRLTITALQLCSPQCRA
jgi:hypothetical protein